MSNRTIAIEHVRLSESAIEGSRKRYLQQILLLKVVQREEVINFHDLWPGTAVGNFRSEVTAFEADETIGEWQAAGSNVVCGVRGFAQQGACPGP